MQKLNLIKILGLGGTVLSLAASLMSDYANKKETEETIAKKVAEALASKEEA